MNYHGTKGLRYAGSKGRCGRMIRTIQSYVNPDGYFLDLFCGAGKVVQSIRCRTRVANDLDPYIISLLRSVQDGWNPPRSVSEGEYRFYMNLRGDFTKHHDPMMGFAGYGCSFGARFFQGYARSRKGSVNFAASARTALLRQKPFLKEVEFYNMDYGAFWKKWIRKEFPTLNTIYCDIPYKGTKLVGSAVSVPFDHERFWHWAWGRSSEGNTVLVSEYTCPKFMRDKVKVVWEQKVAAGLRFGTKGDGSDKGSGQKKHERLFLINPKSRARVGLGLL